MMNRLSYAAHRAASAYLARSWAWVADAAILAIIIYMVAS